MSERDARKAVRQTVDRPVLAEVLTSLRPGHTLVVWRLDRPARSLKHPIETLTDLATRGIGFRSLTEQIDTTTPGGKLDFHVLGALAEFERDLTRERTHAGLAATRARGRIGGWPKALYDGGQTDIKTICRTLGISRATLHRSIDHAKERRRVINDRDNER